MKRMFNRTILFLGMVVCVPAAYSAPQWYLSFGAGYSMPRVNGNTTVNNNSGAGSPFNQDIYSIDNQNDASLMFEVGKRWMSPGLGLQSFALGLQYQYFMPVDIGRQVTQYSSPAFTNYSYDLDLEANVLLLNARVELFSWHAIAPFINIGGGISQLTASGYSEQAYTGITARTSPGFQGNANYQLIYQLGAGFNWALSETLYASINYIYQPLGNFSTKVGTNAWSNRKLDFGNVNAQSVLFSMTYVMES